MPVFSRPSWRSPSISRLAWPFGVVGMVRTTPAAGAINEFATFSGASIDPRTANGAAFKHLDAYCRVARPGVVAAWTSSRRNVYRIRQHPAVRR